MSDKFKQILAYVVALIIGVAVFGVVKYAVVSFTNLGAIPFASLAAFGSFYLVQKFLAKWLNVKELRNV